MIIASASASLVLRCGRGAAAEALLSGVNWDLVKGIDKVGAKEENSFILAGGSGEVNNVISHVLQPGQDVSLGLACERVYSRPTEV